MNQMSRVFFLFLFAIDLIARNNPFLPTEEAGDIPVSNNYIQAPGKLDKVVFTLPDSSRIIESIEVTYINIDGSIGKKKIEIEKQFNRKKRLLFGYNFSCPKCPECPKCPKCPKNIVIKKTIKKKITTISNVPESNSSDTNTTTQLQPDSIVVTSTKNIVNSDSTITDRRDQIVGDTKNRVVVSVGKPKFIEFDFDIEKQQIRISTNDKKYRHYMLVRPNRIVIDFEREIRFRNQTFNIDRGIFKELKILKKGSSRYRVVIYIEDGYRYKFDRDEEGYKIECYKK